MTKELHELVRKEIGSRVQVNRKKNGLTQAQLAEKIEVSVETVSRLERGVAMPSVERLYDIAKALRVRIDEIFAPNYRRTRESQPSIEVQKLLRGQPEEKTTLILKIARVVLDD
jgi:transcriptional regulator with XRE-family HTH domain